MDHYITVGKLKELLADPILKDGDFLVPNAVANLAVYRGPQAGCRMIGWIDLLEDQQHVSVDAEFALQADQEKSK